MLLVCVFVCPSLSLAELDLNQEVLVIPDTHDVKPYIWSVARNPKGYELTMTPGDGSDPRGERFSFEVRRDPAASIHEMQVFITDGGLQFFRHVRPLLSGGRYSFFLEVPRTGTYRFEIVFRTDNGWVNLTKDISLKKADAFSDDLDKDKDYDVGVKLIPRKVYAEHVVTFLFNLSYQGAPVRDIEKVDGADMHLASWDEDRKEFIFVTPKQNLGGPEVAVSAVFMRPGKHKVFSEFIHNGRTRTVELVIDVLAEPRQYDADIEYTRPAD